MQPAALAHSRQERQPPLAEAEQRAIHTPAPAMQHAWWPLQSTSKLKDVCASRNAQLCAYLGAFSNASEVQSIVGRAFCTALIKSEQTSTSQRKVLGLSRLEAHQGAPGRLHAGMVPGLKDRHRAAKQRDGVAGDPKACCERHILPGPAEHVRGACTAAGVSLMSTAAIPYCPSEVAWAWPLSLPVWGTAVAAGSYWWRAACRAVPLNKESQVLTAAAPW